MNQDARMRRIERTLGILLFTAEEESFCSRRAAYFRTLTGNSLGECQKRAKAELIESLFQAESEEVSK